jgi:hypothetical protein
MLIEDERKVPLAALEGLHSLFRQGHIIERRAEREGMKRQTDLLTALWDRKFPGFPSQYFPYTSFRGQYYRGRTAGGRETFRRQ